MAADSSNDKNVQGDSSAIPGQFRSPELVAHKHESDQAAQAVISQVGDAPLTLDADQVIRVGHTRVTLDTVIAAFLEGATAEEIAEDYSSLHLADVYLVLGFYLRNKTLVDQFLDKRHQLGDIIENTVRSHQKNGSLRKKLMDRVGTKARANG